MTEISLKQIGEGAIDQVRTGAMNPETRVRVYAGLLAALNFIFASAFLAGGYGIESPFAVGALCVAAALAQRGQVQVSGALKVSISLFPILLAAVLFGPIGAMAVSVASMLGEPTTPVTRWVVYASSRSLTGAAAGLVALTWAARASRRYWARPRLPPLCIQALDLVFAAIVFNLRGHGSPLRSPARDGTPLSDGAAGLRPRRCAAGIRLSIGFTLGPSSLLGTCACRAEIVRALSSGTTLASDLAEVNKHLERANLSFATLLWQPWMRETGTRPATPPQSPSTRETSPREWSSQSKVQLAHLCGLVHDIGKVGLAPGLLEKPGALTLEERREMEEHSVIGERILANVDDYAEIARVVRHHHERVDGQGYPRWACLVKRFLSCPASSPWRTPITR